MASLRSNAGVASEAPNANETPPKDTVLFASLELAIEPANIVFVTVPESPVPIKLPVLVGKVKVTLPLNAECAGACNLA